MKQVLPLDMRTVIKEGQSKSFLKFFFGDGMSECEEYLSRADDGV